MNLEQPLTHMIGIAIRLINTGSIWFGGIYILAVKAGNGWLVDKADVERAIAAHRQGSAEQWGARRTARPALHVAEGASVIPTGVATGMREFPRRNSQSMAAAKTDGFCIAK